MSSARTKQTATEGIFTAVSKYASNIPIIVVATKSDEFSASKFQEAWRLYAPSVRNRDELFDRCDVFAADKVSERLKLMESEIQEVDGGRFDGCVALAKGSKKTFL